MKPLATTRALLLAGALAAAPGCSVVASAVRSALRAHEKSAVLGYLGPKYDRDGDGRISRDEYGRNAEAFARLDRDGDGFIGREDFDRDLVPPSELVAPMILVRTFGADGAESLGLDELEHSFARLDRDGDRRFGREEFDAQRTRVAPIYAPDLYPWLVGGIDGDGDGALSLPETKAFFARHDRDGDGRLGAAERDLPGRPARTGTIPPSEREPAPDFTLARHGGAEAVTLSRFAGKKPVALVFGSYT